MTTYWRVVDLDQNPVEAKEGKVKPTADPEVMAVFKNALRELKAAGAEIVDPQTLPDYRSAPRTYYTC